MLGKSNSIKYEYATAIKSPDLKSTLINAGVIEEGSTLFQDKLKAESTESQDLIFFNRGKNHIAQIGIYNRTIKDAINRRSYDDKDSYRNDSGETISSGGKVSVKYFISREAIIDTSYSVTETKLPDVSDDEALNGQSPEGIPTSEMAVSYLVSNDQYRFSITGNYIDELTTSSKNLENHDGFISVDTHFSYSLQDNMAVMFKARNILGEDIRVPNFQENYNPRTTLIGFEGRF
jgi:outer membrane receptor protein involved in Fe transport